MNNFYKILLLLVSVFFLLIFNIIIFNLIFGPHVILYTGVILVFLIIFFVVIYLVKFSFLKTKVPQQPVSLQGQRLSIKDDNFKLHKYIIFVEGIIFFILIINLLIKLLGK